MVGRYVELSEQAGNYDQEEDVRFLSFLVYDNSGHKSCTEIRFAESY